MLGSQVYGAFDVEATYKGHSLVATVTLALCITEHGLVRVIGPNQSWMTTGQFFDKIDDNLKAKLG